MLPIETAESQPGILVLVSPGRFACNSVQQKKVAAAAESFSSSLVERVTDAEFEDNFTPLPDFDNEPLRTLEDCVQFLIDQGIKLGPKFLQVNVVNAVRFARSVLLTDFSITYS